MFANIGPWQLLIILVIVLAIFGTKKLSSLGSDLGKSVKGFRNAMNEADEAKDQLSDSSNNSDDADFDNTPVEESSEKKDA